MSSSDKAGPVEDGRSQSEHATEHERSSMPHDLGSCDPCIFFALSAGCQRRACPFCHIHTPIFEIRPQRPGKQIRMRLKRTMLNIMQCRESSPDRAHDEMQRFARKSPFARTLLTSYLETHADVEASGSLAADGVHGQPTVGSSEDWPDPLELESFLKGKPLAL
ncbi:rnf12-b [Symbiodinium sp. CCMP2456]|nr:rnf12-b [Symbiodinium sp. CCMP2456]